ncbi:sugar ABC transporter ATP-binding protein [Rhizobium sp. LjRoot98]|uniref:sugar ABC transporter ATP-binding protein n=1 Tax=Rhizobium sp. LjRoot98 TaxID=3342345 RepID=UPI003ECF9735
MSEDIIVAVKGAVKRFGGVTALKGVDVQVKRGEVHALVGENGAGKSTLGKVLAGVCRLDEGNLLLNGQIVRFKSPRDALRGGIALLEQEISLAPSLSIMDNVFLGSEIHTAGIVHTKELRRRFHLLTQETGFHMDPDQKVADLPIADQQKVEILRSIARRADVIVMDEPTAPLTIDEARRLRALVKALRDKGTTIIYVSHFLDEVLELADSVSILRDGQLIRSGPAALETAETLVSGMLGRSSDLRYPPKNTIDGSKVILSVRGLCTPTLLQDINLDVRAGEIVGLAGLVGSGRSEIARAIFGRDKRSSGEVRIEGQLVAPQTAAAIDAGIAFLPESRKTEGLLMGRSIRENISLAYLTDVTTAGVVGRKRERSAVDALMKKLDIRAANAEAPISSLSGGNQQKALFAKWLFRGPKLLIADEPTRGVDVGAKHGIYALIRDLAAEGMAVLLISSELEEVIGLSDRVLAMRSGQIVAEFEAETVTQEQILAAAFGTAADSRNRTVA